MKKWCLFFFLSLILTACSASAGVPQPAPTVIPPAAGLGVLSGQIQASTGPWEESRLYVYAATFYGDEQNRGFYMLDPTRDPAAELGTDGIFELRDLKPQKYVLVVGPTAEQGLLVVDEENQPRIFEVLADEVIQAGSLSLAR
jgi:hypothetical protein